MLPPRPELHYPFDLSLIFTRTLHIIHRSTRAIRCFWIRDMKTRRTLFVAFAGSTCGMPGFAPAHLTPLVPVSGAGAPCAATRWSNDRRENERSPQVHGLAGQTLKPDDALVRVKSCCVVVCVSFLGFGNWGKVWAKLQGVLS